MNCQRCAENLPAHAKFCLHCGSSMLTQHLEARQTERAAPAEEQQQQQPQQQQQQHENFSPPYTGTRMPFSYFSPASASTDSNFRHYSSPLPAPSDSISRPVTFGTGHPATATPLLPSQPIYPESTSPLPYSAPASDMRYGGLSTHLGNTFSPANGALNASTMEPLVRSTDKGTEYWSADRTEYKLDSPNRKEYTYCSPDGKDYVREVQDVGGNYEDYVYESRKVRDSVTPLSPRSEQFRHETEDRLNRMRRDMDETFHRSLLDRYPNTFRDSFSRHLPTARHGYDPLENVDRIWSDVDRSFSSIHDDIRSRMETQFRAHRDAIAQSTASYRSRPFESTSPGGRFSSALPPL